MTPQDRNRFRVRYSVHVKGWIIHDTAIGCQWAACFARYQDAVQHLYNERTRVRGH